MRPLKSFEEYIKLGIVKKQSPDSSRSESLIKEAQESHNFLQQIIEKIGILNENANDLIKISYDILMSLIRSKMFLKGFNSSGYGAHEAEVSYLRKIKFPDSDIYFFNQLRFFRNKIMYYGKRFDADYAKKVLDFLDKNYIKLRKMVIENDI